MRPKSDLTQAIILRESGYTLAAICEKTGLSCSSLYRHFKKLDITRGALSKDTLESAKRKLLEDAGLMGDLKQAIASQISDDLALARSIRDGLTLAIEELINDPSTPAALKSRSYAALSTALKTTSDTMRRALQLDQQDQLSHKDLPTLTISKMTAEEIKAAQNKFNDDDELAA